MESMAIKSFALFCSCLFAVFGLVTSQETSFLSIDCGYDGSNYTTNDPSILWISDGSFLETTSTGTGVLYSIAANYSITSPLRTVRYFPSGLKNCYAIPMTNPGRFLVRLEFLYNNYDRLGSPPIFNVSIGITNVGKVDTSSSSKNTIVNEYILNVANTSSSSALTLKICFLRIVSNPFVNAIEVRELPQNSYDVASVGMGVLTKSYRLFCGADPRYGINTTRYPMDPFDRIWIADLNSDYEGDYLYWVVVPVLLGNNVTAKSIAGSITDGNPNYIPQFVFQENRQSEVPLSPLTYYFSSMPFPLLYRVYLYFADIDPAVTLGYRVFSILINNQTLESGFDIYHAAGDALYHAVTLSFPVELDSDTLNITLNPNVFSTATSPAVSGIEIYSTTSAPSAVNASVVNALQSFRSTLSNSGALIDWSGDPCNPLEWTGVTCDFGRQSNTVIELNLSGMGLEGPISASLGLVPTLVKILLDNNAFSGSIPSTLGNLQALETLLLQNNELSGSIPTSLGKLTKLRNFNCDNNSLSGPVPFNPSINQVISLDMNLGLCDTSGSGFGLPLCSSIPPPSSSVPPPPPLPSSGPSTAVITTTVIVIVILMAVVLGLTAFCCMRRKSNLKTLGSSKPPMHVSVGSLPKRASLEQGDSSSDYMDSSTLSELARLQKTVKFTLEELRVATGGFSLSNQIGLGGFGTVFKGVLADGKEVALKRKTASSSQDLTEFYTEFGLLSRVHHRHLVSLIGFCVEGGQQILVYKFMAKGALRDHLYDNNGNPLGLLDWHTRLSIMMGSALGIEYLHNGSEPSIIHRDIKTSNILLTDSLVAHVADFGLSKLGPDSGNSHISTMAKGTVGYLDPEYYTVQKLTDRSDVYSFGVVLLELLTGRQPIIFVDGLGTISIVDWVRPYLANHDILAVLDPTVKEVMGIPDESLENCGVRKSIYRVANLAILCVEPSSQHRPGMSDVVKELKEACLEEGIPEGMF